MPWMFWRYKKYIHKSDITTNYWFISIPHARDYGLFKQQKAVKLGKWATVYSYYIDAFIKQMFCLAV